MSVDDATSTESEYGVGLPTDQPLPFRLTLAAIFVLVVVGLYAFTTVLYVTPNNPLRIYFDKELNAFENWGYQRWSFFAPPPTFADRLYFAFSPKDDNGVTIEILEGIYKRKRENNPRNTKMQVVDYAVSGTADAVSNHIQEINRYRKVHELWGGDPEYLKDLGEQSLEPGGAYGGHIRVLLRYAAMVAANEGIELDGLKCQLAFTRVPLRPFSQRDNDDYVVDEAMNYKSGVENVPLIVSSPSRKSRENALVSEPR